MSAAKHLTTDPACVAHREPVSNWERRQYDRMRGHSCPVCMPPAPPAPPTAWREPTAREAMQTARLALLTAAGAVALALAQLALSFF